MIVVTGAAGFIGSCMISKLNQEDFNYIVAVDDFSRSDKLRNLEGKNIIERVDRKGFFEWLDNNHRETEFIFHLGARTDTTLMDDHIFEELNLEYSKKMWAKCCEYQIPLIYASSAATYGSGEHGYQDDESKLDQLQPLNPYGTSKHEFDKWALGQSEKPFFWCGLKFFNVYGPNEYHKGRMASVVFHAFNQIQKTGGMKLFKSHHHDFEDGKQERDFIYVKDVVNIMYLLMHHRKDPGIYNLGTGKARTFIDLTSATFNSLDKESKISFIDTPLDIREKYQYFTEAHMEKWKPIGFNYSFTSLEKGVADYVQNYLIDEKFY